MQREHIDAFQVQGLSCRTSNAEEFNPLTARIGPLWQSLAGSGLLSPQAQVFGVYHDYANQHLAAYSLLAGVKVAQGQTPTHELVQVPAGDYLVFDCQGAMPAALIAGWGQVWAYFSQADAPARAYDHDFERYLSLTHAQICIGIQA